MAQTGIHYGKKWLWGDNYVNIQGRIMVLVSIPFVFSKIWPGHTSIMKKLNG